MAASPPSASLFSDTEDTTNNRIWLLPPPRTPWSRSLSLHPWATRRTTAKHQSPLTDLEALLSSPPSVWLPEIDEFRHLLQRVHHWWPSSTRSRARTPGSSTGHLRPARDPLVHGLPYLRRHLQQHVGKLQVVGASNSPSRVLLVRPSIEAGWRSPVVHAVAELEDLHRQTSPLPPTDQSPTTEGSAVSPVARRKTKWIQVSVSFTNELVLILFHWAGCLKILLFFLILLMLCLKIISSIVYNRVGSVLCDRPVWYNQARTKIFKNEKKKEL